MEEPAIKEDSDLEYASESEYYTPVMTCRMIEGPLPIVPVGELEVHLMEFGTLEEVAMSTMEGVLEEEEESSEGKDVEEFIVLVG